MIKVEKDISAPPASLDSDTTKSRRNEVIESGDYPSGDGKYDGRYKHKDIKEALSTIYNDKCAYCEQNVGDAYYHIEHYRPKSIYYWQAYSWDNLLLCCEKCNKKKGAQFKTRAGKRATFDKKHLEQIHTLSPLYNKTEKPMMIHPEMEDVADKLVFDLETGSIRSDDDRCDYTIECCKLYRKGANDKRKAIWDDFKKRASAIILEISNLKKQHRENILDTQTFDKKHSRQRNKLKDLVHYFHEDSLDPKKEYLAFRRYIVRTHSLF